MGCDIHLYLEKRIFRFDDKNKENGIWVSADKWTVEEWKVLYPEDYENNFSVNYNDRIYSGRNYDLFAILADVRNGRGFAGVKTREGFNPISYPKGLPDDISTEVKREAESWGADGHSHSWLTLKELLDYDWQGQKTVHYGIVNEKEYKVFKEKGYPESYSGGIMRYSIRIVSNEEMEQIIEGKFEKEKVKFKDNGEEMDVKYYTQVSWEETYAESCQDFLETSLEKLKSMV